jgi:hypothetical protein
MAHCVTADSKPPDCPNWSEIHPSYKPIDLNHPNDIPEPELQELYVYSGKPCPIMWSGMTCVLGSAFATPLLPRSFAGLHFRPVNLYADDRRKLRLEDYLEMRVTGRVRVDEAASGLRLTYRCPICGASSYSIWDRHKGLHLEGTYEDWPDVFRLEQLPGYCLARAEFAQAVISLQVPSVSLTKIGDLEPFDWENEDRLFS